MVYHNEKHVKFIDIKRFFWKNICEYSKLFKIMILFLSKKLDKNMASRFSLFEVLFIIISRILL